MEFGWVALILAAFFSEISADFCQNRSGGAYFDVIWTARVPFDAEFHGVCNRPLAGSKLGKMKELLIKNRRRILPKFKFPPKIQNLRRQDPSPGCQGGPPGRPGSNRPKNLPTQKTHRPKNPRAQRISAAFTAAFWARAQKAAADTYLLKKLRLFEHVWLGVTTTLANSLIIYKITWVDKKISQILKNSTILSILNYETIYQMQSILCPSYTCTKIAKSRFFI